MSRSATEFLRHMLDEVRYLQEVSEDLTKEAFLADPTLKRAFARSLEIIGEAAKQIPDTLRSDLPEVEWRAITGMRDKVVHHYFAINYNIIWDVVQDELPQLKPALEHALNA